MAGCTKVPVEDEPPKKRKRSYDAAFKLNVVEYAEKNSNRGAGRRFSWRVREWKKQKAQLDNLPAKKRRLDGGGRKPAMPQLEEELSSWIENLRSGNSEPPTHEFLFQYFCMDISVFLCAFQYFFPVPLKTLFIIEIGG